MEISEYRIERLKDSPDLKLLYEDFRIRAIKDYNFESMPLGYREFKETVAENLYRGFILYEGNSPKAFLLYYVEENCTVELNVIHVLDREFVNSKRLALLRHFLYEINKDNSWNTISYPMMGIQKSFLKEVLANGFKTVGQAVMDYCFKNNSLLKKLKLSSISEDYQITPWNDDCYEPASRIIHESFKTAKDALFDPRFLSLSGSQGIVTKIVSGLFGVFLPDATSVLTYKNEPVGVCFANLTNQYQANIPLVGILKTHQGKGLSNHILKNTVESTISLYKSRIILAESINATVETENLAAVKMYKKVGFKENFSYPHAYLSREALSVV